MDCTRREFLAGATATLVGGRAPAGPAPVPNAGWPEPFPAAPLVGPFMAALASGAAGPVPTALSRDSYLDVIAGIVRFFASCQDARGAIIDPYEHRERQYATPAFALAGAVLVASGRSPDLRVPVLSAMKAACADLAAGKAADRHADFFTVLLVHADAVLGTHVSDSDAAGWRRDLSSVVPEFTYVYQPAGGRPVHNWNLVAAAGEFLRSRAGYGRSEAWVEASLARQMEHLTGAGMYRDPNEPMAYDHFARLWALDLVEEGYDGRCAVPLRAAIERAAWASLFMQSPLGELPCGGRSAHHQWNEAEQAVTFETFARRCAARGNTAAASAFKRAARLSLQSMTRWIRPSGELWVVKNRVDPGARHGYESYSFHSQYNLLAAAMLAVAWLRADDRVSEGVSPADLGGFAFATEPAFHKVFLSAGGWYVEVETAADVHYNPSGILRIHHRNLPPQLVSDGTTANPAYTLPARPTQALAFGPEWQDGSGRWISLASRGADDLKADVRVLSVSRTSASVEIVYRGELGGGATAVRQRIAARERTGLEITHAVEGEVGAVRLVVPVLVSDGASDSTILVHGDRAEVDRGGRRARFEAPGWHRAGVREPCRNGYVDVLRAEARGRSVRCVVSSPGA
jgi:hypothetical protein